MQYGKRLFFYSLLAILLANIFLMPNQVKAEGLCDDAVAEAGKKYVRIQKLDGGSTQDLCVQVDQNVNVVRFADLVRVRAVPENSGDEDLAIEAQTCFGKNRPGAENAPWVTLSEAKMENISIAFSTQATCALPEGPGQFREYHGDDVHPAKKRYTMKSGREVSFYFVGIQETSADEQAARETCIIKFLQQPQCRTEGVDLANMTESQLLIYANSSPAFSPECKKDIESCIVNVLPGQNQGNAVKDMHKNDPRYQRPPGYAGPLPDCAFSYEGCRNVNDLLVLFIKLGQALFQVLGTFAFVMFVYGGFTIILSMGNAEKVKKGQEVLVAAVVGIIIAFGAYLIIDFILDALQVSDDFRAIGVLEELKEQK